MTKDILTWEGAVALHGELISDIKMVSERCNTDFRTLQHVIKSGYLDGTFLVVGKDILAKHRAGPRPKYAFPGSQLERVKTIMHQELKSLEEIAKQMGTGIPILRRYAREGVFDTARVTNERWHVESVKMLFLNETKDRHEKRSTVARQTHQIVDYESMLSEQQKQWIHQFIEHKRKSPIKFEGSYFRAGFAKESIGVRYEQTLKRLVFKMNCARQGIVNWKKLTDKEVGNYKSDAFVVEQFGPDDIEALRNSVGHRTFQNEAVKYLKPFLYFVLSILKRQFNRYVFDDWVEFLKIHDRFEEAIDLIPYEEVAPEKTETKIFMSRKQVLMVYVSIIELGLPMSLRYAVQFMISCFLGVRPDELRFLRINHFELDSQRYIASDSTGYGLLRIPKNISKGAYSPSHAYGTLVVPNLVVLLNTYLKQLYEKSPGTQGEGYLFRPLPNLPDYHHTSSHGPLSWIQRYRSYFDGLSLEERHVFHYYTGRHTLHELIIKTVIPGVAPIDHHRSAELQMRHNVERRRGRVGETNYTAEVAKEVYFRVIDKSLNFPWDLHELEKWEQNKGIESGQKVPMVDNPSQTDKIQLDDSARETVRLLELEIKRLSAEYSGLAKRCPRSMTTKEWMERLSALGDSLEINKTRIDAIKRGWG